MNGEVRNIEYDYTSIDFLTLDPRPLYEPLTGEFHPEYGICIRTHFKGDLRPDVVRMVDVTVTA